MGGVPRNAEALRLLAAIEPRTAPGARLTARERLELGLLPGDDDARGVDSLHAAAVASLGRPDSHKPVAFGIRCLLALGELCREVECSERLGLIGGHQTVLRLMTEGRASGDARHVAATLPTGQRQSREAAAECATSGTCAPTAVGNSNSAACDHHPPPAIDEELEGEEDEVQSAAALVAAHVVSSGSSFPMRASFPTGEGPTGLGRFPLRYDFVVSESCAINCTSRTAGGVSAVSAAAARARLGPSNTCSGSQAARGGSDSASFFSILVRPVKERQHSQFDVGFVMWPAAVILSRLLCRRPELVRGRRVLEIGAGLGLAGLVAARLQQTATGGTEPLNRGSAASGRRGAASVTLSDFNPLVLRALEANVALNAGRATAKNDATGESRCGREGRARGNVCGEDGDAPAGRPTVRVRHLDWDKLEHLPSGERVRPNSHGEGGGPAETSASSLGRSCRDGSGSDCDCGSGSIPLSDGSTSRQQEERGGGGGGVKGIEHGERFDLIIASDHICQASDAEGTIRVLHAMLAEAAPAPTPTTTTSAAAAVAAAEAAIVSTLNPSPAEGQIAHPASSPDASDRHTARSLAQRQQHLPGAGEGYSPARGGHAHFVVAHPRTRWGVDSLMPLLRESPGLSFTCEEVSDPDLVAGLEEASYLAWLHVHVWREAAPAPAPAADDSFDEAAAEATDGALLVVG